MRAQRALRDERMQLHAGYTKFTVNSTGTSTGTWYSTTGNFTKDEDSICKDYR